MGGARIAWTAAEVWLLTTVAHAAAGGGLPSLPWVLGLGALVALATSWVMRGAVTPWLVASGLAVAQLGLHLALSVTAAAPSAATAVVGHAHHDHAAMAAGAASPGIADDLSWRMLVAHVISAMLTGFVWWLRRRVVDVVLRLGRPALDVVRRRAAVSLVAAVARPHSRPWLLGDPGRAPPPALVAA